MTPTCLGAHFVFIETFAASLALVLNGTLALLIAHKTSNELRTYSRILLCNCVVDCAFTTVSFLIQLHGDMRQGFFVIVINGVLVGDLSRNLPLMAVYMFLLYATTLYAAVPMICRYAIVCREHVVTKKEFTLLIVLVLLLAALPPLTYINTWWPSCVVTTRLYSDHIENATCQDVGQMYLFPLSDVLWTNACVFFVVALVVSSAYAVIVFCAYKVSRKVKSVKNWSAGARDAHNQIHAALLFQAAAPLLLYVVPIGLGVAAVVGGWEQFHLVFPFFTSFLAWIPVISPLSAILFIKCYRIALRKFVVNALCRAGGCFGWNTERAPCTSNTAVSPLPSRNQS